jgi:hypothetical protein
MILYHHILFISESMLGDKDAAANIAVKNLEAARKFYEEPRLDPGRPNIVENTDLFE